MIKKLVTITALAMLLGSPASYATFKSGNDLAKDCWSDSGFSKGICAGYVIGLTDILSGEGRICAPSAVTDGQVVRIVEKYLKEHPGVLHYAADSLVLIALKNAFPCSD